MKIKLFCFPFAGASAAIFLKWNSYLHPDIELIPIEYPGRGKRFRDQLIDSMDKLVTDIYSQVSNALSDTVYAFFGHSLGSLAAFALTLKFQQLFQKLPVHLFFSGHNAPHFDKKSELLYTLPEERFIKEIISLGGTSAAIFNSSELKELFLPIIRTDVKIADTYYPPLGDIKLPIPFHILYSRGDPVICEAGIMAWNAWTTSECTVVAFEGDHMYLFNEEKSIVNIINEALRIYL